MKRTVVTVAVVLATAPIAALLFPVLSAAPGRPRAVPNQPRPASFQDRLLNIGADGRGTIPLASRERLRAIGNGMASYGESIDGTSASNKAQPGSHGASVVVRLPAAAPDPHVSVLRVTLK